MGSTTPPRLPSIDLESSDDEEQISISDLQHKLKKREKEIQALKFEIDKYKLALQQAQVDCHILKQQVENYRLSTLNDGPGTATSDNLAPKLDRKKPELILEEHMNSASEATMNDDSGVINDQNINDIIVVKKRSFQSETKISPTTTSGHILTSGLPSRSDGDISKVSSRSGDADSGSDDRGLVEHQPTHHVARLAKDEDILDEMIQDVGEIDLDLELNETNNQRSGKSRSESRSTEVIGEANDDEDIISDELLTSLTDAAINNLSQLAALQEQCESQQHSHNYPQQRKQPATKSQSRRQSSHSSSISASAGEQSVAATSISPQHLTNSSLGSFENSPSITDEFSKDPYDTAIISNQAGLAISASNTSTPITLSTINYHQQQQPISSSSSISPNSTIQTDLTSSHSLASVVAAAAVAAAAVNDQQHSQLDSHQSGLVSSALQSSEFSQTLHHHQHQQYQHAQHHSPIPALTSMHFSPSTSLTPSPCSLLDTSQSTRRSNSNASSLMSPTTCPNYLRRQFMTGRFPIMSPSPSSGLATGSSSGASSSLAQIIHQNQQRSASALAGEPITSRSGTSLSGTGSTAVSPLMSNKSSSQARLNNMQIRHKFGYLGSGKAQFNSPHGFCLGLKQEIVVADTNNHRVCIFDKSGTYITQFGSPGKEEGQLWNPRKVAILHRPTHGVGAGNNSFNQRQKPYSGQSNNSDNISSLTNNEPIYVVCDRGAERSRMQLFTKDGAFIKKISIHYIDIVAGLAITQNGLIIVVDSVSPTVYIINGETGILNGWFDCSGYMKEPSDIAVKSDVPGNEYFICDFKGHCVVVFSEQGEYLRKIGHDGLTSYPNGIDISDDGDILVGDSHGNRFHVVVFDRNGNFVSQFECPHVKVSRCCGLKITREGYIVTLAKNNHHVLVLDTIHI